jgi:hypothetical protein
MLSGVCLVNDGDLDRSDWVSPKLNPAILLAENRATELANTYSVTNLVQVLSPRGKEYPLKPSSVELFPED